MIQWESVHNFEVKFSFTFYLGLSIISIVLVVICMILRFLLKVLNSSSKSVYNHNVKQFYTLSSCLPVYQTRINLKMCKKIFILVSHIFNISIVNFSWSRYFPIKKWLNKNGSPNITWSANNQCVMNYIFLAWPFMVLGIHFLT